MELTQLRYFCAVAEPQHMTKTAERLHIAQPALTQSIHRLEKELGVALFAAKGRGIELTECGRYFYKSLTPVLRTLEDLPRELRAMANVEDNTVHMNMLAASRCSRRRSSSTSGSSITPTSSCFRAARWRPAI